MAGILDGMRVVKGSAFMAIVVALVLLGLLVALGAAMFWQERSRIPERSAVYGVEDSIAFVLDGLSPESRQQLTRHDVRRILEWSVRFVQDPSARSDPDEPPVIGGGEMSEYVQARALDDGHIYDGSLILEVLDLQSQYLAAIGAVGAPVDGAEDDEEEPDGAPG